ncbi:MAG: hypothetical protein N3A38_17240, partial [Planctomycetota bacterium]|nr:hypothetical protein [Planctomycetota bacterium]
PGAEGYELLTLCADRTAGRSSGNPTALPRQAEMRLPVPGFRRMLPIPPLCLPTRDAPAKYVPQSPAKPAWRHTAQDTPSVGPLAGGNLPRRWKLARASFRIVG